MENDILDSLDSLGYTGPLTSEENFEAAINKGPESIEYTQLVSWLTRELKDFCGIEDCANPITDEGEADNFVMEVSSCLRELSCPLKHLYEGNQVSERLKDRKSKLQLLNYLTTELCSARIIAKKKPHLLKSTDPSSKPQMKESDVAKHLRLMLMALGFPKPPPTITPVQLFGKVENKVKDLMTKHPNQIGKPLMKSRMSMKQWESVTKINDSLSKEYMLRREMLLKRLDVTIQSFMWSDAAKQKQNEISSVYQPIRKALVEKSSIDTCHILAARDDLTRLHKTSSGYEREKTKCAINRVLIPKVPDRGGRAWELEPPPPEMPSFMKRDAGPLQQRPQSGRGGGHDRGGRGGRGRGGGGGGRGGKVQGGWGDSHGQNQGGNWSQGGGGYGNQKHGGYQDAGGYYGGYNQGPDSGYHQGQGDYQQGYHQGQGGYNDYNQGGRGGGGGGGGRGRRGSARGGRGGHR